MYQQFSECYHLQYNRYSIRSIYLTSFWFFLICLASITSQKQINKLWGITKRETFLYVIVVSGVRLISKIKFHFINVLLAQMQISNVCPLAMRKVIVSTIALGEELNSFFSNNFIWWGLMSWICRHKRVSESLFPKKDGHEMSSIRR